MVTITVEEVLAAADVLEKISELYSLYKPSMAEWCADDLRGEIEHIREFSEQLEKKQQVALMVEDKVLCGLPVGEAVVQSLEKFHLRDHID